MSDVTERMLRPFTEAYDTVWPDTPANSENEHLSIVICGHVDNGRLSDVPEQFAVRHLQYDVVVSDKHYLCSYDVVTDCDVTKKARENYDHIILEAVRSAGQFIDCLDKRKCIGSMPNTVEDLRTKYAVMSDRWLQKLLGTLLSKTSFLLEREIEGVMSSVGCVGVTMWRRVIAPRWVIPHKG